MAKCQDCEFMLRDKLNIYKCLKDSGALGIKETHPLYPACVQFKYKELNVSHGFKAERIW